VFVRTGLSESDSIDDIVRAARQLHPERPGELDVPAWLIGRSWCRPRSPKCSSCPISWACPSSMAYTERAKDLVSLGAAPAFTTRKRASMA
jgi:endonuclease III